MKILGIPLRRPRRHELTAACVMAVGLWVASLGLMHLGQVPLDRADAGALLLVSTWACVSARLGIRIGMGHRHLAANLLVSAALLGAYSGVVAVAA